MLFIMGAGNGCGKTRGDKTGLMYCMNGDAQQCLAFKFNQGMECDEGVSLSDGM